MLGHTNTLAEAIAQGAKKVKGADVELIRVPEILAEDEIKSRESGEFRNPLKICPSAGLMTLPLRKR